MQKIETLDYDLIAIYGQDKIIKWKKAYPIFNSESVNKWIQNMIQQYSKDSKKADKFSITAYLKNLQDYCDFYEVQDVKELLLEDLDNRNTRLSKYLANLLAKGRNETAVKNAIQSNIKSFFSDRGSPIIYQLKCLKSGINKDEIILLKNTIRLIEERLTPQYKLIMKIQSQLGFRIEDTIEELTSGKYKIELYQDRYFIKNFKTQKEGVQINFVFFPEELSILFKSINNCIDLTKLDLTTLFHSKFQDSENKIDQSNYLKRIKQILEEIGLEGNLKTHSFRKFFESQVRKTGLDIEFSEHLMGHEGQNLSQSYNNNLKDIQWFYTQWLKVEPELLINSEIVDKTDKEFVELKEKLIKNETRLDSVIKENIQLKDQLLSLSNQFKTFTEFMNRIDNVKVEKADGIPIQKIVEENKMSHETDPELAKKIKKLQDQH